MISFLTFIAVAALLALEGALIARTILRSREWLLPALFGLPIAALLNALVVCAFTAAHVPLTVWSLGIAHVVLIVIATFAVRKAALNTHPTTAPADPPSSASADYGRAGGSGAWLIAMPSAFVLLSTLVYSFSHAVLLPTFQYDSATNWTMRSEISFYDKQMAFDTTEIRGMAKPQYPFLFHALQVTANQGQNAWNDSAANGILFLLSLSTLGAIFLLLKRRNGLVVSLATPALLLSIPLFSLHLGQGYGDLNLAQYFLLSLLCFYFWLDGGRVWLALSAVFIAASVWTKSEGTFFGLLPWLFVLAIVFWKQASQRKEILHAGIFAGALSIPWHLFALSRGFLLTPHGSDFQIGFHMEGLREAMLGMFSRGSFSIAWYAILFLLVLLIVEMLRKKLPKKDFLPLVWPFIVFLQVLFVYLMTPNVRFLLNAESYYRQMMIPAVMFALACAWIFMRQSAGDTRPSETPSRS